MVLAAVLAVAGVAYLVVGALRTPSQSQTPCAGVRCPAGRLCHPSDGRCVPACALPGLGCPEGQTCEATSGTCQGERDAGLESEGDLSSPPVSPFAARTGGPGSVERTRAGDSGASDGAGDATGASASATSSPSASAAETARRAGALGSDPRSDPSAKHPLRCEESLCHPRQRCVGGRCEPWECGPDCGSEARCVQSGDAWECKPAPCEEDRFRATNAAPGGAAEILGGTYELSLCAAPEDWFSLTVPAGTGLLVEAAFDEAEADLDLELHPVPLGAGPPLTSALGFGRKPVLVYRAPDEGDVDVLLRALQPVAAGHNHRALRYTLLVQLGSPPPCRSDTDCTEDGQVCAPERRRCEQRACGRNFECKPDERCEPSTGECERLECDPDVFDGANTTIAESAPLEIGRLYDGLTVCNGERDWFVMELVSGRCVHVRAEFPVPTTGGVSYDIDLNLYDRPDGTSLVASAMRRIGDGEQLWYDVRTSGPHFLEVTHALRNTYALQIDEKPGKCIVPCASMDDCMHLGMECDLEGGRCFRWGAR